MKVKSTTNFYGSLSTTQGSANLQFRVNEPAGGVGLSGTAVGIIRAAGDLFEIFNQRPNGILNLLATDVTGQIGFWTGGFDRMRITAAGNVGIGITNPTVAKFHVISTATDAGRFESSGLNAVYGLTQTGYGVYGEAVGNGVGGYFSSVSGTGLSSLSGTSYAIDAINTSTTQSTSRFINAGNHHAIEAISYGSFPTGRFISNGTGNGINVTANDASAYAGNFNNTAGSGVAIYAFGGTGAYISSAGKAIEAYGGGTENSIFAANTSPSKATIKLENYDASGAAVEIRGQISIPSAASNRAIFNHGTTAGNIIGNYTILSYPNALASDFLMVTQTIGAGGNLNVIGVNYAGGAWTIYNVNGNPMPVNTAYNVLVIKQ